MQSLTDWIGQLYEHRGLLLMGHDQRRDDLNLGLGWLYYGLGRLLRLTCAVVIGSYRGFVPLVIARALGDNCEGGEVHFIDPSFADGFWKDGPAVRDYFARFGASNVRHHLMTTQQFAETDAYQNLPEIGMVFIDGYHSAEQASFDFETFAHKLAPNGMMLLHDSVWRFKSDIYGPGREYEHDVCDFVTELKRQATWQVLDVPFGSGLTIVRRAAISSGSETSQTTPMKTQSCAA